MAHDKSDVRLRRSVIGAADPPVGTTIGADVISKPLAPDPLDPGYIPGTSNAAMKPGPWRDEASPPKPNQPPPHPGGPPFANLRSK